MRPAAAIVLAAGASTRLGTPKQLVRLGGETLLQRTVRIALEAGLDPVFGVLPPDLRIDLAPAGMTCVINLHAAEGMASSIRAGLEALAGAGTAVSGVVILACDQPGVTAAHLRELASGSAEVVASAYAGRKGVPAYFSTTAFAALMRLRGDAGARELLRDAAVVVLPNGELDVDDIDDLAEARKLYEGHL